MVGATFGVAAAAEVIRAKKGISALNGAQVDTAQSKFGVASALFDGTTDLLITDSTSNFAFGDNQYTIEGWFRLNSTGKQHSLFDIRPVSGNDWVTYVNTSNKIEIFTGSTGTGSTTLSSNIWYHIAIVRDSSNLKVYINGSQEIAIAAPTVSNDRQLRIGGGRDGGSFANTDLNGWMDEVRVSNIARYTTTFTPSTTQFVNDANTLLLLHMDGTDASTYFEDDNGVRSKKGITAIGNAQVDTAQSKFGESSALFDGSGDYLTGVTGDYTFGTSDFTIECWFRYSSLTSFATITDFRFNAGSNTMAIYFDSGVLKVHLDSAVRITSSNSFNANTWYHVALSRSGTSTKLFVDGTQTGSTYTDSTNYSSSNKLAIGANYDFNAVTHWNGHIDEFRISNTARYTTTFTPSTAPFVNDANTVLLLHMDGLDASTVFMDDNNSNVYTVKNTLTDIDATQQGFRHTRTVYMGDDSSQNPVFAIGYRDNSDFSMKVVAFKVSKTNGSLTIGTPATVIGVSGDPDNNFYSAVGITSENSDAATRTTSYSNFGYIGFYHGGSTNLSRMYAFSVNTSTLAVTVGTGVSHFSTIDSGVVSMTYVGNSRAVFGMRGGSGFRYYNMFSRSGTTLTSVATATQSGNAGTAGNFLGEAAVANSGTNYRMATISSTYGLDTIQWATTTYYIDQEPLANILGGVAFSGTTGWVLPLNTTDKFALCSYNSTNNAVYAQAVSVNWGSTTPTNTVGTRITLTGTDNSPLAFGPGRNNDEFFYIYESSSTIRYRKITASGTTLTQGSEVDTTLSSTNLTGSSRYEIAKSGSGDYLVGVVDDSTSAIWQVIAVKLD
jgi:hypothetical protein